MVMFSVFCLRQSAATGYIRLLLMFVGWLCAAPVLAQPAGGSDAHVVTLGTATERFALGRQLQLFEDPAASFDVRKLAAGGAPFRNSTQAVPNFGFTRSVWWFRIRLDNRHPTQREWLLENRYPLLDRLDLYQQTADGRWQQFSAGRELPFAARPVAHPNQLFRLNLPPGAPVDIYLRVQTGSSLQLPLVLWHPDSFAVSDRREQVMMAAFYGLLMAMFVFNLLLFLTLRDPTYGYYVLYVGCFGLFQFALNGLAFEYLWPESPAWGQCSIPFFLSLALVAMIHFSRLFLQLKRYSRLRNLSAESAIM